MRLARPRPAIVLLCSAGAACIALVVLASASSAGSDIKDGHGRLTVETSPAVDSPVMVGGVQRNSAMVSGLELRAGTYTVCFGDVAGYLPPPCERIDLADGQTVRHVGEFQPAGFLAVETQGASGTIVIDGIDRDRGAVTLPVAAGTHEVCFADVNGYEAASCQTAVVAQHATTSVVGTYTALQQARQEPVDDPGDDPTDEPVQRPVPPAGGSEPSPTPSTDPPEGAGAGDEPDSSGTSPTPRGFTDVGNGVHASAIKRMAELGIIGGYPDGTFRPAAHVTRGQVASMVAATFHLDADACSNGCPELADVGSSVHAQAIRSMIDAGVVSGYPDGTFRPEAHLTRAQLAGILAPVLGLPGGAGHPFVDIEGTTHEAHIAALYHAGVTRGSTSTTYSPWEPIRRDQFASMLSQSLDVG